MTPYELNQIRQALGKSALQMTELLGVHERTWYRWASGERPIPQPIANLARLLLHYTKLREAAHG